MQVKLFYQLFCLLLVIKTLRYIGKLDFKSSRWRLIFYGALRNFSQFFQRKAFDTILLGWCAWQECYRKLVICGKHGVFVRRTELYKLITRFKDHSFFINDLLASARQSEGCACIDRLCGLFHKFRHAFCQALLKKRLVIMFLLSGLFRHFNVH